ncbi:hypothetical protein TWF730_010490 [Orbilia blumenaviensis]|uniref:TauD/TfdA-like domain-containing protein n=1 Tax=Orbilia blumenaviensis TaxID=1796055 RepID=A0AAV9USW4_9PEZI
MPYNSPKSALGNYFPKGLRGIFLEGEQEALEKLKSNNGQLEITQNWPREFHSSALSWSGHNFPTEGSYTLRLGSEEIDEIEAALKSVETCGIALDDIKKSNFPLPTLGSRLQKLSETVHHGSGIAMVKGLAPEKYTSDQNLFIYFGLSSYLGENRARQKADGRRMARIFHKFGNSIEQRDGASIFNASSPMAFHNDLVCDVLAFYCLDQASEGGESLFASLYRIYNELVMTKPSLVEALAMHNWPFDTYGYEPPYFLRPLLFLEDGKLISSFAMRPLIGSESYPRTEGIPSLTEIQREALDEFQKCAQKHQVEIRMQAGDMLFVNNLAILHSRRPFQDSEEHKRHLVRLWLRNEEMAWRTPAPLARVWMRKFGNMDEVHGDWSTLSPQDDERRNSVLKRPMSCGSSSGEDKIW